MPGAAAVSGLLYVTATANATVLNSTISVVADAQTLIQPEADSLAVISLADPLTLPDLSLSSGVEEITTEFA